MGRSNLRVCTDRDNRADTKAAIRSTASVTGRGRNHRLGLQAIHKPSVAKVIAAILLGLLLVTFICIVVKCVWLHGHPARLGDISTALALWLQIFGFGFGIASIVTLVAAKMTS